MTFEGQQIQGAAKILEKLQVSHCICWSRVTTLNTTPFILLLQSLTFQKIERAITAIDSQPMFDGGVLINVLGRLKVSVSSDATVLDAILLSIWFSLPQKMHSTLDVEPDWRRSASRIYSDLRAEANRKQFFRATRCVSTVTSWHGLNVLRKTSNFVSLLSSRELNICLL